MKPLRVALVHRDRPRAAENRMVGWWSYVVPEFDVKHYPVPKGFCLDREELARQHDLVVLEDAKVYGTFVGRGGLPVFYHVTDSTLSDEHYQVRCRQAKQADAILVDWDDLDRFRHLHMPIYRFNYCVNDRLMRDYEMEKDIDVGSYQSGTVERRKVEAWLRAFCKEHGYVFQSGVYPGQEYPMMMTRSKIVVNLNRNPNTRGHRIFDIMACRACMLTSPTMDVSGETRRAGFHYLEYDPDDLSLLGEQVDWLLDTERWETFARNGHTLVRESHTWQVRASYLHGIVEKFLETFH